MMSEKVKKCESCEFCEEYSVNKYKVCWLITDDEVMYIDDIPDDYECEDYRQRGKGNEDIH